MELTTHTAYHTEASSARSQLGIYNILAMLGLGASGPITAKFQELFGTNSEQAMYDQLRNTRDLILYSDEIKGRTGVFVDSSVQYMQETYLNKLKDLVKIASVDLNNPAAVDQINAFIEKNAGIPDVLQVQDVFGALSVFVDAFWFKDTWVQQFNPQHTQVRDFTRDNGEVVPLPMMKLEGKKIRVLQKGNLVGVSLDFAHGARADFVMGTTDPTEAFASEFELVDNVDLLLPKFNHVEDIDLQDVLVGYGLEGMFQPGALDGIYPGAYISKAKQKLDLSFTEEGAEVKVVTYAIPRAAIMGPQNLTITFDQPFVYRIVTNDEDRVVELVTGYFNA